MGLTIVKEGTVQILENKGSFDRILTPGWHWSMPVLTNVKDFRWVFSIGKEKHVIRGPEVPTCAMSLDPPSNQYYTADQSQVFVDPHLEIIIEDPHKFVYQYGDGVIEAILKNVDETIRGVCMEHEINVLVPQGRRLLVNAVKAVLAREGGLQERLGFKVASFIIETIRPDGERVKFDKQNDLEERKAKAEATRERQKMDLERERKRLQLENQRAEQEALLANERARQESRLVFEREQQRLAAEKEKEKMVLDLEINARRAEVEMKRRMDEQTMLTAVCQEEAKRSKIEANAKAEVESAPLRAELQAYKTVFGDQGSEVRLRMRELEALEAFAEHTHFVPSNTLPWLAMNADGKGLSAKLPALAAMMMQGQVPVENE